ncbi:MAG: hypothetical protein ABSG67_19655 [Thermoguttaceae bacterium]
MPQILRTCVLARTLAESRCLIVNYRLMLNALDWLKAFRTW